MPISSKTGNKTDTFLKIIIALIILGGITVRVIVYLSNRNLIIDESNIARNLFERDFARLLLPLKYEQYAPPVFLWIEKFNTMAFGFSEYALRLYPLLASIASFFVLYALLKRLMPESSMWYPLLLFAGSFMLIRYSSEVKQYMPDILIVLSLMLLALTIDIRKHHAAKFMLWWFLMGSLAIWSSMPSVFALAGVGAYYGWNSLKEKNFKGFFSIVGIGLLWLAQFAFYYYTILEPQANSDYLQRFHQYDFFYLTPNNAQEWNHDLEKYRNLVNMFNGEGPLVLWIQSALLVVGIIMLIKNNFSKALLLLVPLAGMLLGAGLRQFSLMPRVALFSVPILIIITAYGFHSLMQARFRGVKIALIILALYGAGSNIAFSIRAKYKYEQLTDGLEYVISKGITGPYLYLYHSSGPAFIYYTQIHPDKDKWQTLTNDYNLLRWDTYYGPLGYEMKHVWVNTKPVAFVFTNSTMTESSERAEAINRNMREIDRYEPGMPHPPVRVFIYQK